MADQTLPLNVSDEMKADDERQNCVGMESDEELCSSSSDSAEELYSSSTTDACGDCCFAFQGKNRLEESTGGVLVGEHGYVWLPEGRNLRAD